MAASAGLPDNPSIYAAEGTIFHHYAALCLQYGLEPDSFVGAQREVPPFGKLRFDEKMAKHMAPGLHLARSFMKPGVEVYVEKRVSLHNWIGPKEFGTIDLFMVDFDRKLIVDLDWKYGAGVPVDPFWNDQAILYTLGGWDTYAKAEFERRGIRPREIEVKIVIEQPRAPGGGGIWETDMNTLLREGRKIRQDADATLLPNAPFKPGSACKFCRAARHNTCKARAKAVAEAAFQRFDRLEKDFDRLQPAKLPDRRALTPKQRSQLLLNRKLIEDYLSQLHDDAMNDLKKGRDVPGLKLVAGRNPPRKWRKERIAELILTSEFGEEAYTRKYLTPTMVEEKIGKERYERIWKKHVEHGDSKPILVPETDKRDPIRSAIAHFDDITEG